MFRRLIDLLNGRDRIARVVAERYPSEDIHLATSATVLHSRKRNPVGRSLLRLGQLRGVAVFTDRRIFSMSNWLSPILLIYIPLLAWSGYRIVVHSDLVFFVIALTICIFLAQRRPFQCDIPIGSINDVQISNATGITGTCDIVVLHVGDRTIQIVTSERLPEPVKDIFNAIADRTECDRPV